MSKHPEKFGRVPDTRASLLTLTSKMPCASYSLPAHKACPRENGDICDSCYASKGCYTLYPNVAQSLDTRFQWTVESMRTFEGRATWVTTMITAIRATKLEYFRVHDSGDMFSPAYAECWLAVCAQMPEVKFWIPTRAYQQPSGALPMFDPLLNTLRKLASLPNVTVRPSALNFGDYAPNVKGLHAGSTAAMPDTFRAYQCPAHSQGGMCGDCRACWDRKDMPIAYARH